MDEFVRPYLVRRAFDDHLAVVHHRHPLGDSKRDVHVVLDQDQGDVPVELEQEVGQGCRSPRDSPEAGSSSMSIFGSDASAMASPT